MVPLLQMSYRSILDDADTHFARVVREQPSQLQCGSGCNLCCYGLFEISPSDAAIIGEALTRLPPQHRAAIVRRAEALMETTSHPDIRSLSVADKEAWFSSVSEVPCPALGSDGLCSIYQDRPMICRTFGLPIREGAEYIGDICELNFHEASEEEKREAAWDIENEDPVAEDEQYTIPEAIVMANRLLRKR